MSSMGGVGVVVGFTIPGDGSRSTTNHEEFAMARHNQEYDARGRVTTPRMRRQEELAKKRASAQKRAYVVTDRGRISYDGDMHDPGATIRLDPDSADRLLELGAVEVKRKSPAAAETTDA